MKFSFESLTEVGSGFDEMLISNDQNDLEITVEFYIQRGKEPSIEDYSFFDPESGEEYDYGEFAMSEIGSGFDFEALDKFAMEKMKEMIEAFS